MWIAPETTDPVVFHQPTRKSVGYFGAVRLRDGKFTYHREDQKFNAQTFLVFLKQLKHTACRSGRRVVVILDNARYHHENFTNWRHYIANSSNSITYPLTVLNSTPLSVSGNLPGANACITFTSRNSQK